MHAAFTTSSAPESGVGQSRNGGTGPVVRIDVGPVTAFPEGSVTRVRAGGRTLAVVRHDDRWYALRDRCPHQGADLSHGRVVEQVCARLEDGRPVFGHSVPALQCPWHGWSFRLADGGTTTSPGVRVRNYPVRIVGDRVVLELP